MSDIGATADGGGARKPVLRTDRLLLVATGAAAAGFLPFWINWVRETYVDTQLRIVLTRSAARFVTVDTVALLSGSPVVVDEWSHQPDPAALHVELAEWPDAIAVYPASAHFVARMALGLYDTPATMAIACTSAIVGLSPSVPPGMVGNLTYQRHIEALSNRDNIVVAPTTKGRSASTRRRFDGPATPLWTLLGLMEDRRAGRAGADAGLLKLEGAS